MSLTGRVYIARRFQRAVRIDSDFGDAKALEGFVCPKSSEEVLTATARHVAQTGHGAFTWTGPFGSGKSSLVVALSALLGPDEALRKQASTAIGHEAARAVLAALPPKSDGWRILPVVGRRDDPAVVIGEALEAAGFCRGTKDKRWTDKSVVSELSRISTSRPNSEGGLILFIDEMGKFLEAAAHAGSDVYLFQLLAEAASRSEGRFVLVGILHQSFEDYAGRLSREMRDEWSKIQGRFVDLPVNIAGEEQIELVSRAIENSRGPVSPGKRAALVAAEIKRRRPASSAYLPEVLEGCWPIHPVVACLLGPISRRRFGQNQRSIFGFLNSAEPYGFQDFVRRASDEDVFEPDQLWDYLRANLEPSILASPDGHRWALASEAIERCEALGGDEYHIRVLKVVAVIDLFKERSGLVPNMALLLCCVGGLSEEEIKRALQQLQKWSLIIFRRFSDAYAVYAGSDFDIESAVGEALEHIRELDFAVLQKLAGLQPILAKRHYHETGSFRWFDVQLAPVKDLVENAATFEPRKGTIGQFLLAVPTEGESAERAQKACREAARLSKKWDIIAGISQRAWAITDLARELIALESVKDEHPDLAGDPVAQREISAHQAALQGHLEAELRHAFDNATWHRKGRKEQHWRSAELNGIASQLADVRFSKTPRIHNELLNRIKPSSNAVAGQNALLRHMVVNEGRERLGIEGFPAEGGLFASLLEATGLYSEHQHGWRFVAPENGRDPCGLAPLWAAAAEYLTDCEDRTVHVSEIYDLWSSPPFGLKEGLMPVLAVAFILSRRDKIAIYRQGVFQPRFKDVDVEMLATDPTEVQLRWMDLSEVARKLLSGMADVVRGLDESNSLSHLTPIDVARGLISVFERLHAWTKRTTRLSANAVHVRNLFKHARDPNKFLFDDIPATFGIKTGLVEEADLSSIVDDVRDGLKELTTAYPSMLHRLMELMLQELQVPNASPQALAELRTRAENIKSLGGDFRLDAFVARLSQFDGTVADIESIASFAADKPLHAWTDPDVDKAAIETTALAQQFIRNESFARVKGRPDKRHAMAVVVGVDGRPAPLHEEFTITDADRQAVDDLIARVGATLSEADPDRRNVILAALAELSALYMDPVSENVSGSGIDERVVP
ncbi:hypothetical protein [Aliiroseovarius sp.]|uniref:hypothetical protein n=1 Tax=Aliiroseovarius sp. TaxID=1872442 RepID=UPI003BACD625